MFVTFLGVKNWQTLAVLWAVSTAVIKRKSVLKLRIALCRKTSNHAESNHPFPLQIITSSIQDTS